MRLTRGLLTQRPQRSERGEGIGFGILDVLFLIEEETLTSRSCGTQTRLRAKVVLSDDFDSGVDGGEVVELNDVGVV